MYSPSKTTALHAQRLHSSPSLPNLGLSPRTRPLPEPSPTSRFPAPLHSKFGPLDLAASQPASAPPTITKYPLAVDALTSPTKSRSPRHPPHSAPLTPPLTPSSSLNETLSAAGQPTTPIDSITAERWRNSKKPRQDHGSNVISLNDDDDEPPSNDLTPTERVNASRYPRSDDTPTRFLLVSNVPRTLDHAAVRAFFSSPVSAFDSNALKGIWAGHVQPLGVAILVFYDLRACEGARRTLDGRRVRTDGDEEVVLGAVYLSVDEAEKFTGGRAAEIENGAAFVLHLNQGQDLAAIRNVLASFGTLAVVRDRDGRGEWFYVEYYDIRETKAALDGLRSTTSVLEQQMQLYPVKSSSSQGYPTLSPAPSSPIYATSSQRYAVPFPSTDRDRDLSISTDVDVNPRQPRPRSASAGAGDGVKAFVDGPMFARLGISEERRRSLAGIAEQRRHSLGVPEEGFAEEHRHSVSPEERRHSVHEAERQRSVSFGQAGGREREPEQGEGGDYDLPRAGYEYAGGAAPSSYPYGGHEPYRHAHQEHTYRYAEERAYEWHAHHLDAHAQAFIPTTPQRHAAPAQYILPTTPRRARPNPRGPPLDDDPAFTVRPRRAPLHAGGGSSAAAIGNNAIDFARIEAGLDTRTTVMIKNIPNKMSDRDLLTFIARVCPRRIDFFYLRMDFQNGCNVGYAFVNFITVDDLLAFAKARLGVKWNMYSSEKVLQMSYANYQGKESLVEKFKNSCVMDEKEAWRPRIFYSDGGAQGLPEPFPPPTHQKRKERSAHNRGALFVPGHAARG